MRLAYFEREVGVDPGDGDKIIRQILFVFEVKIF